MATIDISRSHGLALDVAKERAEQLAKDLEGKIGIRWQWDGSLIRFKADRGTAKGVNGSVTVTGSQVRVEIDLPLLLRAMKGVIAGKVHDKLERLLG
jgi:putative polyhydroxyalkanoate system protein